MNISHPDRRNETKSKTENHNTIDENEKSKKRNS